MVPRFRVPLSADQIAELELIRRRHPKPYVRERAAGILKLHAGERIEDIARTGLTKPHEPETITGWVKRYLAEGRSGLLVREGGGRKPSFSPSVPRHRRRARRGAGRDLPVTETV